MLARPCYDMKYILYFHHVFNFYFIQTSIVRTTLRNDLGMRIVEVDNEAATLEGTDVLFTG